nr:hypothetical protein [Pseudomonas otitidis]
MRSVEQSASITLQIVSIVFFTFISFLCIGLPLAVLPGYVHNDLGYGSVLAGVVISTQYAATLLSRPFSGAVADRRGAKHAVLLGLGVEAISRIPASSRSSALGAYAVFFDLALGLAGPLMGLVANAQGFAAIFLVAAGLALAGMLLGLVLLRSDVRQRPL